MLSINNSPIPPKIPSRTTTADLNKTASGLFEVNNKQSTITLCENAKIEVDQGPDDGIDRAYGVALTSVHSLTVGDLNKFVQKIPHPKIQNHVAPNKYEINNIGMKIRVTTDSKATPELIFTTSRPNPSASNNAPQISTSMGGNPCRSGITNESNFIAAAKKVVTDKLTYLNTNELNEHNKQAEKMFKEKIITAVSEVSIPDNIFASIHFNNKWNMTVVSFEVTITVSAEDINKLNEFQQNKKKPFSIRSYKEIVTMANSTYNQKEKGKTSAISNGIVFDDISVEILQRCSNQTSAST